MIKYYNKNKLTALGFTLIEVIASMAILGVIIVIIVSSVQRTLDYSFEKAYDFNLDTMEKAAKEYVLKKNIKLNNLSSQIITVEEMVNLGIIDEIIDPEDKDVCQGYVLAQKFDNKYYFTPYLDCGDNYQTSGYGQTDEIPPVITVLGENPITVLKGTSYTDEGATAIDNIDGDLTSKIVATSNVNMNVYGTYTVTYTVYDKLYNKGTTTRTVKVAEQLPPTVSFSMNGNATYAQSRNTTVTVSDTESGVKASSLKYQWTDSTDIPTEESFSTTFTNGDSLSTPAGVTGEYYLWILAKDNEDNTAIERTNLFKLDNIVPFITILGSNPETVYVGSSYSDAGATASDNIDGDLTSSIVATSNVNINQVGTYSVNYNVADSSGNNANEVMRTVNVVDTTNPTVSFSMNGNATYAKSRSTTVTVSDAHSGVNTSSLKYLWNTSTTAPSEGSFSTTFSNGASISTPAGVTGGYYLWILAKDNAGNTLIDRTNVFNLDNTIPVITLSGSNPAIVASGSSYSDAGATASDNINGNITGSISVSSNVNTNATGNYTVTYNVSDSSGNAATQVTRTVIVIVGRVEVLIIAGGGGGGAGSKYGNGGGGGAGGVIYNSSFAVSPQGYGVTVGGPGTNGGSSYAGNNGGNSSFGGMTAIGGGGGGGGSYDTSGRSGGSGGGASGSSTTARSGSGGTSGQGNSGGNSCSDDSRGSGGGGGATSAGGANAGCSNNGTAGGYGYTSSISGSSVCYAGGGGGGVGSGSVGAGQCGGGNGNSGGGGGGATQYGSGGGGGKGSGGQGYGGIVIIRYLGSQKASGGSISSSGGYTIHTFTGSGTFTVSSS